MREVGSAAGQFSLDALEVGVDVVQWVALVALVGCGVLVRVGVGLAVGDGGEALEEVVGGLVALLADQAFVGEGVVLLAEVDGGAGLALFVAYVEAVLAGEAGGGAGGAVEGGAIGDFGVEGAFRGAFEVVALLADLAFVFGEVSAAEGDRGRGVRLADSRGVQKVVRGAEGALAFAHGEAFVRAFLAVLGLKEEVGDVGLDEFLCEVAEQAPGADHLRVEVLVEVGVGVWEKAGFAGVALEEIVLQTGGVQSGGNAGRGVGGDLEAFLAGLARASFAGGVQKAVGDLIIHLYARLSAEDVALEAELALRGFFEEPAIFDGLSVEGNALFFVQVVTCGALRALRALEGVGDETIFDLIYFNAVVFVEDVVVLEVAHAALAVVGAGQATFGAVLQENLASKHQKSYLYQSGSHFL